MDDPKAGSTVVLTSAEATERWEAKCQPALGCGVACCYHEGSPCEALDMTTARCTIYAQRFGRHHTVAGHEFICAPMAIYLQHKPAPPCCGYRNVLTVDGVPVVQGQP